MVAEDPIEQAPTLDAVSGVMAHGLLNSMAVIVGTLTTLADHWGRLDDPLRQELLQRGVDQAQFVTDTLRDLVLGLPVGASSILEELDVEAGRRREQRG